MLSRWLNKKEASANKAKERLKIVIESQRMSREGGDDLKRELRIAIMEVIQRRYSINEIDLDMQMRSEGENSGELELNIDIHGVKEKRS